MQEMLMNLFLPLAAVLLLIPTFLTVYWFRQERYSGTNLAVITCLVVLSITALRMPLNLAQGEDVFTGFIHGLVRGMHTIGMGEDLFSLISDGVHILDGIGKEQLAEVTMAGISGKAKVYSVFVVGQYMISVGLCGFVLIKTISRLLLRWQLKICLRPVFFFSHLTEESIHLAHSIQQNMQAKHRRALFCFTSVQEDMNEDLAQAWREAGLSHAFQLAESLNANLFPLFSSEVNCILCCGDEESNLKTLSHLLQENSRIPTHHRRLMKYFIYAQSDQAEQSIDTLAAKYIPGEERSRNQIICMLNRQENLAVHILDKVPLHEYVTTNDRGEGRLNILVAGSTPLAIRFLRNAFSCGQMDNCALSITLADPLAEEVRQKIHTVAPLLKKKDMPIVQSCGKLEFHPLDSHAAVADDALLQDVQYVLLAYDSDDENMKAARRIRTLIERQRLTDPDRAGQEVAVVYVVKDPAMNALCREIDPAEGFGTSRACRMIPVGSIERQHQTETLFGDALLVKAFLLDRAYGGKTAVQKDPDSLRTLQKEFVAFMNKAYERRSTVSTALHLKYRETVLQDSALSEKEKLQTLAHAEHLRWNAYMIMSGYAAPSDEELQSYCFTGDATHRSKLLKLHPCIVPSVRESTPDLWAPQTVAVDELDRVSQRLHAMALERLRAYLPEKLPAHPEPRDKADIIAAAEALPEEHGRKQAVKLAKALFSNYKQFDLDIVACTADVLRNAGDPDIQAALRLFWLEVDA